MCSSLSLTFQHTHVLTLICCFESTLVTLRWIKKFLYHRLKTMVCDNGPNLPALNTVLEWFRRQCSPEMGQSFCPVSSWSLVSIEIYKVAKSPSVIHTLYIQIHFFKVCIHWKRENILCSYGKKLLYGHIVNILLNFQYPLFLELTHNSHCTQTFPDWVAWLNQGSESWEPPFDIQHSRKAVIQKRNSIKTMLP